MLTQNAKQLRGQSMYVVSIPSRSAAAVNIYVNDIIIIIPHHCPAVPTKHKSCIGCLFKQACRVLCSMYEDASHYSCRVCQSSTDNTNLARLTACRATACASLSASGALVGAVASMRFPTMPCTAALDFELQTNCTWRQSHSKTMVAALSCQHKGAAYA